MKSFFRKIACVVLSLFASAEAKELLFHKGPAVSTPDASLYSPLPDSERHGKNLTFIYEFFVEEGSLEKLPSDEFGKAPLPAARAVELASKSAEVVERETPFPVRKLELLSFEIGLKKIRYYLITLIIDDSAETHRVVLMDGTVLKPRLRNISK